jgi:hypothetical protein
MPSRKEIPKNQIVFLKSENSLRSNNSDLPHYHVCFQRHSVNSQARFFTKNNLIFLTEFFDANLPLNCVKVFRMHINIGFH